MGKRKIIDKQLAEHWKERLKVSNHEQEVNIQTVSDEVSNNVTKTQQLEMKTTTSGTAVTESMKTTNIFWWDEHTKADLKGEADRLPDEIKIRLTQWILRTNRQVSIKSDINWKPYRKFIELSARNGVDRKKFNR